jgi:hypothetical protein
MTMNDNCLFLGNSFYFGINSSNIQISLAKLAKMVICAHYKGWPASDVVERVVLVFTSLVSVQLG